MVAAGLARRLVVAVARGAATLVVLALVAQACVEAAPGDVRERAARVAGMLPAEGARVDAAARARAIATVAATRGVGAEATGRILGVFSGLRSWRDGRSVATHVAEALPATLGLCAVAAAFALLAGLGGALLAAARAGGRVDRSLTLLASLALAAPVAWVAVLALRAFAWGRPWAFAPVRGGWWLPGACLGLVAAALVQRFGRAALVEALAAPFAQAARARGASPARVLTVHALAAARVSLLALLPIVVAYLLGAASVIERAFDIPGLGAMLLDAAASGDAPVVVGGTLTVGAAVVLASLCAEALAPRVDPRLDATNGGGDA
jgi:peptide/nickel transport system permease protein